MSSATTDSDVEDPPMPGIVIYLICVFSVSAAIALLCMGRCLYLKLREDERQRQLENGAAAAGTLQATAAAAAAAATSDAGALGTIDERSF